MQQIINLLIQLVKEYGLVTVILLIAVVLLWLLIIYPVLRLFWGFLKNLFTTRKRASKNNWNYQSQKTVFKLERTEKKRLEYFEGLEQWDEIILKGGSVYEINHKTYPNRTLKQKILEWDKVVIVITLTPKK